MKLTNKQIKKIIKEEISEVLNENFSPNFEKIKLLMVRSHEMFNVAMILFDEVKKNGSLSEAEIELLQKVANYVGPKYKDKKLRKEQRSLASMIDFMNVSDDDENVKRFRQIGREREQLRKEIVAAEKILGYGAFGSSIRRNLKGDYSVLQDKEV